MTLTRFGDPSQTSARSSMITTMFVSQGNSLCKLFLVMPRIPFRQSLAMHHGGREIGKDSLPDSSRERMRPPKSAPVGSITLHTSIAYALVPIVYTCIS